MVNILAIISNQLYQAKIYQTIKDAEKINNKIVYVSLNKTYKTLVQQFTQDKIAIDKFYFIDSITASVITPAPSNNCLFLPNADDVKILQEAIISIVKEKNADMMIFDSLSSLRTYQNTAEVERFVTSVHAALSVLECSSIFTCLQTDSDMPLLQHIRMSFDKVFELT